ncbi:hypothetical protein AB204_01415 [Xenorhabdus khoisanae]|uniref:Uncharacterized protein n=1 Tax=Xenorhabdus khoisanae TaxID=880157 RepID=A0A0J5FY70_9GAMM|nr:hypothetical protein AB204_01415 [Xenorhabdus khoisanae]
MNLAPDALIYAVKLVNQFLVLFMIKGLPLVENFLKPGKMAIIMKAVIVPEPLMVFLHCQNLKYS